MNEKLKYLIFCMEAYKLEKHLTGLQVYDLFKKYHFDDYIMDLYELLHIQGTRYLIEELDEYQARQDKTA
jgi:hypothetical protein